MRLSHTTYRLARSNLARVKAWQAPNQKYFHTNHSCHSKTLPPSSLINSSATNLYPWSDPSDPSGLQYAWNELVESLGQYGAGGYHPTYLGDKFFEGR